MLRHYMVVAVRAALRNQTYTLLNVIGMSVSLASSALIFIYLEREFSYNRYHTKAGRTHKVFLSQQDQNGHLSYFYATSGPVAPALQQDFPEVEDATRFMSRDVYFSEGDGTPILGRVMVADDRFTRVFDFRAVEGDPITGLADPYTAFITEGFSRKLFGDAPPIGKTVLLSGKWFDKTYTITGILEDIPRASTPDFATDVLTRTWAEPRQEIWTNWRHFPISQTYIVLNPEASPVDIRSKLGVFAERRMGESWARSSGYEMMPLTDLHLQARQRYGLGAYLGSASTSYALATIGVLIVVVACINFVNLTTARSARRFGEVGLRKVVGAARRQLAVQFLGESTLLCLLSGILACAMAIAVIPALNGALDLDLSTDSHIAPMILLLSVGVGLVAGVYPALILSGASLMPTQRSGRTLSTIGSKVARKTLVVGQFTISLMLFVCTIVISQQAEFLRTADPGFNQDALVVTRVPISKSARTMKTRLEQVTGVQGVTLTQSKIGFRGIQGGDRGTVVAPGKDTEVRVRYTIVDEDFLDVYQIRLLEGRPISASDAENHYEEANQIIVNRTGAERLGLEVGDRIIFNEEPRIVKGICADFHYLSMHDEIGPFVLLGGWNRSQNYITMRIEPTAARSVLSQARDIWHTFEPNRTFDYHFMADVQATSYREERLLGRIVELGTGLAIAIAVLGLIGLISYTVETRTREVAIRKTLGATDLGLVRLLTQEFVVLAMLSGLIALPCAYVGMRHWLQDFAYRIPIGVGPFFIGVGATLAITLLAISFQALRAARANPVDALSHT
jgi:putative ABC transport system permease protein